MGQKQGGRREAWGVGWYPAPTKAAEGRRSPRRLSISSKAVARGVTSLVQAERLDARADIDTAGGS